MSHIFRLWIYLQIIYCNRDDNSKICQDFLDILDEAKDEADELFGEDVRRIQSDELFGEDARRIQFQDLLSKTHQKFGLSLTELEKRVNDVFMDNIFIKWSVVKKNMYYISENKCIVRLSLWKFL